MGYGGVRVAGLSQVPVTPMATPKIRAIAAVTAIARVSETQHAARPRGAPSRQATRGDCVEALTRRPCADRAFPQSCGCRLFEQLLNAFVANRDVDAGHNDELVVVASHPAESSRV